MKSLRFNRLYASLLALAVLFAFVIPTRVSDAIRGNFQTIYWPVARPAQLIGMRISNRITPVKKYDDGSTVPTIVRNSDDLLAENQMLRVQLANMSGRIAQLEALDKVLASVGDVRALCDRFAVVGATSDAAAREGLHITGTSFNGLKPRMPVLFGSATNDISGGGIAGIIDRVQLTGATVELTTDRAFGAGVGFARFVNKSDGTIDFVMLATPRVLARGDGNGKMTIRNLSWQQAKDADLRVGDWVVLSDEDWPDVLQRYRIGRVEQIENAAKGAGYPIITVAPPIALTNLRDVMVMVRGK